MVYHLVAFFIIPTFIFNLNTINDKITMKIIPLLELRRSSNILPKKNSAEAIMDFAKKLGAKDKPKNYFISFTTVDKLGINPGSTYSTPNGIYAYPLDYVIKSIKKNVKDGIAISDLGMHKVVPFAGGAQYINIFRCTGKVIDLADDNQCESMYKFLSNMAQNDFDGTSDVDHDLIKLPSSYKAKTAGEKFWSLSLYLANGRRDIPDSNPKVAIKWNAILRKVGVAGIIDSKGKGIIHTNEKTQAYFTNLSELQLITRLPNISKSGSTDSAPATLTDINNGKYAKSQGEYILELITPISKIAFSDNTVSEMMKDVGSDVTKHYGYDLNLAQQGVQKLVDFFKVIMHPNDKVTLIEEIDDLLHETKLDHKRAVAQNIKSKYLTNPGLRFSAKFITFFNNLVRRRLVTYVQNYKNLDYAIKTFGVGKLPDVSVIGLVSLSQYLPPDVKKNELQKISDLIGDDRYDALFQNSILYKLR